jgi:hypothetical protein
VADVVPNATELRPLVTDSPYGSKIAGNGNGHRPALLRITAADRLVAAGVDVDAVLDYTSSAKRAVADGLLGYTLIIAEKPS